MKRWRRPSRSARSFCIPTERWPRKIWKSPWRAYEKAKVDTQTALDHIRILGGDPQRPSAVIEVHAPVSGTIVEQNVTAAAGVKSLDNSPNLFTIADLSQSG